METGDRKNTGQQEPKIRYKRQIQVFIVCLFIATCIWFLIKLSKEYTYESFCRVAYINFPHEKLLSKKPDTMLTLSVRASGYFTLYRKFFPKTKTITIDLSRIKFKKNGTYFDASVQTTDLFGIVQGQLSGSERLSGIYPGLIQLRFEHAASKKVPVKPVLNISYEKQFGLYQRMILMPDSITVTGPKDQIDTLTAVYPEPIQLQNLRESQYLTIMLHPEKMSGNVRFDREYIKLVIPVVEYTETQLEVPVSIDSLPEGYTIKTYPEKVSVIFRLAVRDYHKVSPVLFSVRVNAGQALREASNKIKVNVLTTPSFVTLVAIEPEQVEYIISK